MDRPTVRLQVDGDANTISTATPEVTSSGDFDIVIENTGAPTHVHIKASEAIAPLLDLDGSNVYVEDETEIPVDVKPIQDDIAGTLTVTSSYGSASTEVGVVLESDEDPLGGVDVDESLGQPVFDDEDEAPADEVTYTGIDFLIGGLIGVPIVVIVLWGIISGNLVVPVLAVMLAVMGGAFVWLFKHHPQTATGGLDEED